MFVCCECCVLSGRGLCDELITRPEELYRLLRRCIRSRNLVNEETLAHIAPKEKIIGNKQVKVRGRTSPVVLTRENVDVQTEFAVLGFRTDDKLFYT